MRRRPNARGGFFIVWGSRSRITDDGSGSFETICPACRQRAHIVGKLHRQWFTVYFIPIFPTGDGQRITECSRCFAQFQGTIEELRQQVAGKGKAAGGEGARSAMGLLHEMSETPRDSARLLQVLRAYMQAGEAGEAVAAGSSYKQAAEGSDGCLGVLARAYLKLGYSHAAARHAAAALALNPGNADALEVQAKLPKGAGK